MTNMMLSESKGIISVKNLDYFSLIDIFNLKSTESWFLSDAIAVSGNFPMQEQHECGHMIECKPHHKFCAPSLSSYSVIFQVITMLCIFF